MIESSSPVPEGVCRPPGVAFEERVGTSTTPLFTSMTEACRMSYRNSADLYSPDDEHLDPSSGCQSLPYMS